MNKKHKKFLYVPDLTGIVNVQLLKDCGIITYNMHKYYGFDSVIISKKISDSYPYLEQYLSGVKIHFMENGDISEKLRYITDNATDIDAILFNTFCQVIPEHIQFYKKLNPNGKVYLALDANSGWMDSTLQTDSLKSILSSCDIVATSCRAMQNHLNEKYESPIYYIPNGYTNLTGIPPVPFEKKKNVILNVSRQGTYQKATNILMEAFALIHDKIPDWTLRLVGSIEKDFEEYIENYFVEYPELTGKVIFTREISDKVKLQQEFYNAKIFALPSRFEGGCPNVVTDALYSGCVMAVSKIDAYEEAINYGKCGKAFEIGNIEQLSEVLLSLAQENHLESLSESAHEYAENNFDMKKVTDRLYWLLFGGETDALN